MGYAFISYSSQNQNEADRIRELFEDNFIDTWMAPYSIPAGSKYAQEINQALKGCSCFVLLLTDAAQNSTWVAKEVERAINYKKLVISIQLENIVLNDEFEFYISSDQIIQLPKIDASSPNFQKILKTVIQFAGQNLQQVSAEDALLAEMNKLVKNVASVEEEAPASPVDFSEIDEDLIVTLTADDGSEIQFEFLDLIEYDDNEYVVLFPLEDGDSEVVILQVEDNGDDTESYLPVDDDILEVVYAIFKRRHKDHFTFEG